jgi:hypothetical protein
MTNTPTDPAPEVFGTGITHGAALTSPEPEMPDVHAPGGDVSAPAPPPPQPTPPEPPVPEAPTEGVTP